MFSALLAVTLTAAPFPLPAVDGKALAVVDGQKGFRLPMRFEKVKAFYEEQFKDAKGVSVQVTGARTLALKSSRTTDAWLSATVKEGELETIVEVKAVLQLKGDNISGNGPPVQFIITRSPEVKKSVETIDHTEDMRAR